MTVTTQPVHIPLMQGVDTKSEGMALQPPGLAVCENAVFEKVGGIQPRPGTSIMPATQIDGNVLDRTRAIAARGGEVVMFAEGRCWSWSETEQQWMDRLRFESVFTEETTVIDHAATNTSTINAGDRATAGGITVYAWANSYRVVDNVTGAIVESPTNPMVLDAFGTDPKVRKVGRFIHIYFINTATTPDEIRVRVIDPDDLYGTIDATTLEIATDSHAGRHFDVDVDTANGVAYLVYQDSTGGGTGEYTSVIIDETATSVRAQPYALSCIGAIAVSYHPMANPNTARVYVARHAEVGESEDIRFDTLDPSNALALVTNRNDIAVEQVDPLDLAIVGMAGNTALVFYDTQAGGSYWMTRRAAMSNAEPPVPTIKILARHSKLASRAVRWTDTDGSTERVFVHVIYTTDSTQAQYVLLDGQMVIGSTNGGFDTDAEMGIVARVAPGVAVVPSNALQLLPQIEILGDNKYAWVGVFRRKLVQPGRRYIQSAETGLREWTYTVGDPHAYQAVEFGESLYIPGGYLAQYDGRRVVENGFWTHPIENTSGEMTTGAGLTTDGELYAYRFYWEWVNDRGEVERSTVAAVSEFTHTTAAADDTIKWTIPTLPYTKKDNERDGKRVVLAVYRTTGNPGVNATYYRASSTIPSSSGYVTNDPNANTISWKDEDYSDTTIVKNERDYLNTGETDNVPCPGPPQHIDRAQHRLFAVVAGHPHTCFFSKLRFDGDSAAFNESLTIALPERGGLLTGTVAGEDALVLFKQRATYVASGQGPLNVPSEGVRYGVPQLISDGVGCMEERSILRIPRGAIFKGAQGYYLLDRGYQLTFIGAKVEAFNDREVTGAVLRAHERQALFLNATGGMLMFDYGRGEWSDWPELVGTSIAMVRDKFHILVANDRVWKEDDGFIDSGVPYAIDFETAWIKLAGLEGYGRSRWWSLLGTNKSDDGSYNIRVQIAYNLKPEWKFDKTYPGGTVIGDPLRIRQRFNKQLVSAVKFQVRQVQAPGVGVPLMGEACTFTALSLEIGFKPGLFRQATTASVET